MAWMCQAYNAQNLAPVVRIPSPDPYQASMALDAGACGIIAPYIETVEQVKTLRGAVKLRPLKGKKLADLLEGRIHLSKEEEEYFTNFNRGNLLFLNIESTAGMEALDEMLDVPGVDGVIIGPHDLSINLGIPEQYSHPDFDKAVRTIISKARAKGVGAGIHYSYGFQPEIIWAKEEGLNIILHSSDITGFLKYIGNDLNTIKEALGDTGLQKHENINI
jgi:4-hydroxy-2-oxoheptanedioate aldolase